MSYQMKRRRLSGELGRRNSNFGARGNASSIQGALSYGWDQNIDLGTSFDFVVDSDRGNDSNSGTSIGQEFASIQAAVNAANAVGTPGLEIKIRADQGQTYKELIDLTGFGGASGNHNTISGYGIEKPKLSARETLTGFVPCVAGDAALLGSNWVNCHKVTSLAKTSMASINGTGLNLFENGTRMDIATDRADISDLFWPTWLQSFYGYNNSDVTYGFDGGGLIQTIAHSTVFSAYTSAQLINAYVSYYRVANFITVAAITAYNGSNTITIDPVHLPNSTDAAFSLTNIGLAIQQGQYVFSDNGDGTITVYIWPTSAANLTANIEYAARQNCIDISTANYATLEGLECFGSAGDDLQQGAAIACAGSATVNKKDITVRHCHVHDTLNSSGSGYGAMHFSQIKNLRLSHLSVTKAMGSHGIMMTGDDLDGHTSGALQEFSRVERSNESPFRNFGQINGVVAHCYALDCGRDTHANKSNAYQGINGFLWWGNKFEDCHGYMATQRSSHVTLAFCEAPIYPRDTNGDGRGYQDQQKTPIPVANTDYFLFNNLMLPQSAVSDNAALNLANVNNDANYIVRNNVAHGITEVASWTVAPSGEGGIEYNVITNLASGQVVGDFSATNTVLEDLGEVVTDNLVKNWTPPAGSPILTEQGQDMTATIAALQIRYPQFSNFDKDVNFEAFDWTSPFVGPDSKLAFTHNAPAQLPSLIVSPDNAQNVLTWTAPANNGFAITNYIVEVDSGSGYSVIADGTGIGLTYTHTGLTNGTSYTYRVSAVNSVGQSRWSSAVSGTPQDAIYSEDFSTDTTGDYTPGVLITIGHDAPGQRMSVTGGTDSFEGALSETIAVQIGVQTTITLRVVNDSSVARISMQSGIPTDTNLYGLTSNAESVPVNSTADLVQTITPTSTELVFNPIFRGTDDGGVFYVESVTIVET